MQEIKQHPSLYGVTNSNRNFDEPYFWGKNQFNSSFPIALACYMRDMGKPAVYIRLGDEGETYHQELSFDDVFGTTLPNDQLFFSFESRYEPFGTFVHDELETIDCVIKGLDKKPIRPLEIKLTTLPDDTTSKKNPHDYGSELVVRSPTMRYMALSMAMSCREEFSVIREIFEPCCIDIRDWPSAEVMRGKRKAIFKALETFLTTFKTREKPFLLQPVWKTEGKSPTLSENCLDVFVWSDFALTRLFFEPGLNHTRDGITRTQRAALRLARFLYEVSLGRPVYQKPIYDGMTYDTLNDKEFAVSGSKTNSFMRCDRLTTPLIKKNEIKRIILGGGQKYLSPERRFDAIIYFSTDLFENEE